jgi:hypothetical protein
VAAGRAHLDAPGAESLTASISMFSQNGPAKANPQESLRPELWARPGASHARFA